MKKVGFLIFCLFAMCSMAGKDYHQGMPWYMWEDNLKKPTKKQKETWAK